MFHGYSSAYPIQRGRILSAEDICRREIIEKIMCGFEVDIACPKERAALAELEREHLVEIKNGRQVRITSEGWLFARVAASCVDAYYKPQEERHARAV